MAGCNIFQMILVVCLLLLTGSVFSAPTQNSTVDTATGSNCTDEYNGTCTINCTKCVGPEEDQCCDCEDGYELHTPDDGIDTGTCRLEYGRLPAIVVLGIVIAVAAAVLLLACCYPEIRKRRLASNDDKVEVVPAEFQEADQRTIKRSRQESDQSNRHSYPFSVFGATDNQGFLYPVDRRETRLPIGSQGSNVGSLRQVDLGFVRDSGMDIPARLTRESRRQSGRSEDAPLTHLQKILRRHERLVADFSKRDKRKTFFQLPYIAISYFDEDGGSLALEAYNVHLYVPRGAIPKGHLQKVYIYVNPSAPPTDGLNPVDIALAPMIQCGPTGLNFKDSVVLMFPHHAQVDSGWKLQAKMCLNDESSSKTWQPIMDDEKDGTMVSTKNRQVTLLLKHFTGVTLTGQASRDQACSKNMQVGVFGPRFYSSDKEYAARIHVWNNDPVAKEKVLENVDGLKSDRLDDIRDMTVLYNMGDVEAAIKGIKNGWQLDTNTTEIRRFPKKRLWKYPTNSETFDFESTSANPGVFACHGYVSQLNPENTANQDGDECVHLSIKPRDISRRDGRCNCGESAAADELCGKCQGNLGTSLTDKQAGSRHGDFAGLPEDTIQSLETEGVVSEKWIQEEADYNRIKHPPLRLREMLKLYFARSRADGSTDGATLLRLLSTFDNTALQLIQKKEKKKPVDENLGSLDKGHVTPQKEVKLRSAPQPGPPAAKPDPSTIAAEITEEQRLRVLAKDLGPKWERLATDLGIPYARIQKIKEENPLCVDNQIFAMLVEWRQGRGRLDEPRLKLGLKNVGRNDLVLSF